MVAWAGVLFFFFSSRRRHTSFDCDWSSDVCSSDLAAMLLVRVAPPNMVPGGPGPKPPPPPPPGQRPGFVQVGVQMDAADAVQSTVRRLARSEERRVGKEGGGLHSAYRHRAGEGTVR